MVLFPLPDRGSCWNCQTTSKELRGQLEQDTIFWNCPSCGKSNVVLVNSVNFRAGQRLLLAGEMLLREGEGDLASVLLCTAVESMLSMGIYGLENYRASQQRQAPPSEKSIRSSLRKMSDKAKLERHEQLAGTTFEDALVKATNDPQYGQAFSGVTFPLMLQNYLDLAEQGDRFVHEGKSVEVDVLWRSLPYVQKTVFLLDRMWNDAFAGN